MTCAMHCRLSEACTVAPPPLPPRPFLDCQSEELAKALRGGEEAKAALEQQLAQQATAMEAQRAAAVALEQQLAKQAATLKAQV